MTAYRVDERVVSQLMSTKAWAVDDHIEIRGNVIYTFQFPGHYNSTFGLEILKVEGQ